MQRLLRKCYIFSSSVWPSCLPSLLMWSGFPGTIQIFLHYKEIPHWQRLVNFLFWDLLWFLYKLTWKLTSYLRKDRWHWKASRLPFLCIHQPFISCFSLPFSLLYRGEIFSSLCHSLSPSNGEVEALPVHHSKSVGKRTREVNKVLISCYDALWSKTWGLVLLL